MHVGIFSKTLTVKFKLIATNIFENLIKVQNIFIETVGNITEKVCALFMLSTFFFLE